MTSFRSTPLDFEGAFLDALEERETARERERRELQEIWRARVAARKEVIPMKKGKGKGKGKGC